MGSSTTDAVEKSGETYEVQFFFFLQKVYLSTLYQNKQ